MSRAKTAEELRAAVEALVRQYIEQGQQAALEGLEQGLSGRTRVAHKRPRRAKNKPRAVRSAAALASLRQEVYEAIAAHPGESVSFLATRLGRGSGELVGPLRRLRKDERVRSVGRARRMRYFPLPEREA